MKVVLDTSIIVAGLRSRNGASRLWIEAILKRRHTLILSVPLLLEYEDVLLRPANATVHGLNEIEIGTLLDALCASAEQVELSYLWRPMLRDPDDEMVLETAVIGRADALLTFNVRDFAGSERFGIHAEQPGPAWKRQKDMTE